MKYTKEERYQIGRDIYTHVISIADVSQKYDIDWYTARNYMCKCQLKFHQNGLITTLLCIKHISS